MIKMMTKSLKKKKDQGSMKIRTGNKKLDNFKLPLQMK